jgi:formate dehydrogenase subunit delta
VDPVVRLANDVARQFALRDDIDPASAVATHLQLFWDPRMRAELLAHIAAGAPDLDPLVAEAARQL